mmetsp:Transcript_20240/g.55885  ORF Transcript_20240/g.55885 Transcript_20240/m.55885 type:complete len:85 (+) Transcript_20240:364-618(+)
MPPLQRSPKLGAATTTSCRLTYFVSQPLLTVVKSLSCLRGFPFFNHDFENHFQEQRGRRRPSRSRPFCDPKQLQQKQLHVFDKN